MNKIIDLSVVIVVKNAAKFIDDCLASVKRAAEIIVVDDFSTDDTVERCITHGAKVFQRRWDGFAKQKNYGIALATRPWVLSLDADERVSPELFEEIKRVVVQDREDIDGFLIPWKNFLGGTWMRYGGLYPDHHLRLFRQGYYFQERNVHESIVIPRNKVAFLNGHVIHLTYANLEDFMRKVNQYTSLQAKDSFVRGESAPLWKLLSFPVLRFVRAFLLRQGYRDGITGLTVSVFDAIYTYLHLAKLRELKESEHI